MSDIQYEVKNSKKSDNLVDVGYERFSTDPINFYRFLSPQDELGRIKIFTKKRSSEKEIDVEQYKLLFDTYIKTTIPGRKIIETLKKYPNIPYRGVGYQTAAIDSTGKATFLDREYWITKSTTPSQSDPGAGQEISAENYYQNICTTQGDEPGVDITINVLRMPQLSDVRKGVDDVSLFLNHIPSYFASQLVPYLDVEFQMPRLANDTIKGKDNSIIGRYLSRPSIIKFLLGSLPPPKESEIKNEQPSGPLTNLLSPIDDAILSTFNVAKNTNIKNAPGPIENTSEVFITGMEMFTAPQTLTNMSELKARTDGRILDVKPFLPPATLTGASITIINAGSINRPQRNASLEFKVHDKARLVEFSDFVRGVSGTADMTVWITFGWLAPRGTGNQDNAYAKFINETMLERFAFMTKNVSYSFDNTGQAVIKLDLNSKAVASIEAGRIDVLGNSTTSIFRELPRMLAEITTLRNSLSSKSGDAEQAFSDAIGVGSQAKILQNIDALEAGDLEPTIPIDELLKILQAEQTRALAEKPINQKTTRLLDLLIKIYQIDPTEKIPVWKVQKNKESRDFAKTRFDSFRREGEDPFLPSDTVVKKDDKEYRIYSEDLVKSMYNYGEEIKAKEEASKPKPTNTGSGAGAGGGGRGGGGGGISAKKQKELDQKKSNDCLTLAAERSKWVSMKLKSETDSIPLVRQRNEQEEIYRKDGDEIAHQKTKQLNAKIREKNAEIKNCDDQIAEIEKQMYQKGCLTYGPPAP